MPEPEPYSFVFRLRLIGSIDVNDYDLRGRIMRGYRTIIIAAALTALLATSAVAQDMLRYFPEDSFVVIEVDFQAVMNMMPPEITDEWKKQAASEIGMDVLDKLGSMTFAMPAGMMMGQPGDFYGLIKSSASIDEIMTAIKASGKKHVHLRNRERAYTVPGG